MNKPDSKLRSLILSSASQSDPSIRSGQRLEPAHRLIVLMPYLEADLTPAARRIWELANVMGARVQLIGLYTDAAQEPSLRRGLVTVSAMVNDGKVSAETEIIFGKDWVEAVKSRWQPGDLVVCFAEQRMGLLRKPLSQILQTDLDVPLFIFSRLYPQNDSRSNWAAQIAAWAGFIAIIFGFFLLQIKIDHLAKDWTHIILPMLSIPVEVWLIWVWNSLFE